jgi:hypothetical protein
MSGSVSSAPSAPSTPTLDPNAKTDAEKKWTKVDASQDKIPTKAIVQEYPSPKTSYSVLHSPNPETGNGQTWALKERQDTAGDVARELLEGAWCGGLSGNATCPIFTKATNALGIEADNTPEHETGLQVLGHAGRDIAIGFTPPGVGLDAGETLFGVYQWQEGVKTGNEDLAREGKINAIIGLAALAIPFAGDGIRALKSAKGQGDEIADLIEEVVDQLYGDLHPNNLPDELKQHILDLPETLGNVTDTLDLGGLRAWMADHIPEEIPEPLDDLLDDVTSAPYKTRDDFETDYKISASLPQNAASAARNFDQLMDAITATTANSLREGGDEAVDAFMEYVTQYHELANQTDEALASQFINSVTEPETKRAIAEQFRQQMLQANSRQVSFLNDTAAKLNEAGRPAEASAVQHMAQSLQVRAYETTVDDLLAGADQATHGTSGPAGSHPEVKGSSGANAFGEKIYQQLFKDYDEVLELTEDTISELNFYDTVARSIENAEEARDFVEELKYVYNVQIFPEELNPEDFLLAVKDHPDFSEALGNVPPDIMDHLTMKYGLLRAHNANYLLDKVDLLNEEGYREAAIQLLDFVNRNYSPEPIP